MSYDPTTLVDRLVVVREYRDGSGDLKRLVPECYGIVKAVEPFVMKDSAGNMSGGYELSISVHPGVASFRDIPIKMLFGDKGWRLAFPAKGER